MGSGLADGTYQGAAEPDEFRTAPLWVIGQHLFFLHDDVLLICWRQSQTTVPATTAQVSKRAGLRSLIGPLKAVVRNFRMLKPGRIQDILNFLRSL
jgi:hypothetical protein